MRYSSHDPLLIALHSIHRNGGEPEFLDAAVSSRVLEAQGALSLRSGCELRGETTFSFSRNARASLPQASLSVSRTTGSKWVIPTQPAVGKTELALGIISKCAEYLT